MEDNRRMIINDGKEDLECEILFTYHSDDFNKDYVVFHDIKNDVDSAAVYKEGKNGTGDLTPVESDEEWAMLEDLLDDYYDSPEDDKCNGCSKFECCEGECDRNE